VARTTHPKAEGIDLVGKIDDGVRLEDRSLFWRNGPNLTVRHGRWKLIVVNKAAAPVGAGDELGRSLRADGLPAEVSPLGQWVLLYDLEKDPGEKNDVAARHPEVVQDLRRRWAAWNEGNVAPQWTSRRSLTAEIDGARFELFN
jgi:arylsulfatase A-like enzyme